jgi:hypothetical protein
MNNYFKDSFTEKNGLRNSVMEDQKFFFFFCIFFSASRHSQLVQGNIRPSSRRPPLTPVPNLIKMLLSYFKDEWNTALCCGNSQLVLRTQILCITTKNIGEVPKMT